MQGIGGQSYGFSGGKVAANSKSRNGAVGTSFKTTASVGADGKINGASAKQSFIEVSDRKPKQAK